MSVSAIIEDGKVVNGTSETSASDAKKTTGKSSMDKDAFMQLLVAQMKYQDPLEPTSNTEYISQYATFSELEQMQNMSASLSLSRASAYVGETVIVHSTSEATGETKEIEGKVDYVVYENNKAYLSIDGTLYNADDVYATVDTTYKTAYDLATAFAKAMNQLPGISDLTVDEEKAVTTLKDGFNSMTAYQQSFIANDYIEKLEEYVKRMEELTAGQKENEGETEGETETEGENDSTTTEA